MKKLLAALAFVGATLTAAGAGNPVYVSADSFPLLGRGIADDASASRYQRLPDSLKTQVARPYLWELGTNTAGMAVRFATDSPYVNARWRNTAKNAMNHFTPTGIRGLDLYCLQPDSTWRFAGSARPDLDDALTETTIVANMRPGVTREFLLFLPLYDGIAELAVGIEEGTSINAPAVDLPRRDSPVVVYGTSITQGGCASRPAMAWTNILERRLNCEFVNLGFSGNGQLDLEIAPVVAAVASPALFILDFVPNVTAEIIDERMEPFIETIRRAHPDTPILLIENPVFPHSTFDLDIAQRVESRNAALRRHFEKLIADGDTRLYHLASDKLIGLDGEATVDGIHFTDLGFTRYADALQPLIELLIQ